LCPDRQVLNGEYRQIWFGIASIREEFLFPKPNLLFFAAKPVLNHRPTGSLSRIFYGKARPCNWGFHIICLNYPFYQHLPPESTSPALHPRHPHISSRQSIFNLIARNG
jgi:hypothetical protein